MGLRHLIVVMLVVAPLSGVAQDWRDVRDQSRSSPEEADKTASAPVHIYRDKPRSYMGGNLAHARVDLQRDENATLTAAMARLGGMSSDHVGMELRFGAGPDTYTFRSEQNPRNKQDFSIDYLAGLYFTARAPFLHLPYNLGRVYAQGYLGVAAEQLEVETRWCNNGGCRSDKERHTEQGLSYGAALGLRPMPEFSLALEVMQYVDKDDIGFATIEAGILYHF